MRRILLVMSVAALMAAMLAVTAMPALATVHPLARMECANANAPESVQNQDPPGLTPGGPDSSHAQVAQPIRAVTNNFTSFDSPALKPEACPAPQK